MEIDHFKCKSKYKDEVVEWGNLLPSCSECNNAKRDHDVIAEPIINPLTESPKDYLYVQAFRFYPRKVNNEIETVGRTTIDVLDINNRVYFERRRSELGFQIAASIEKSFEIIKSSTSSVKRNKAISDLKSDLVGCGPEYEYSAVLSTFILYEYETFNELESYLKTNNLWDSEFEDIKATLTGIAMPK